MHGADLRDSNCCWIVPGRLLSMCTVAGVPPERVRCGGVGLRMLIPLDQGSRPAPGGCRSVECGPVRLVSGPLLHGAGHAEYCASTQWLGHATGATVDESIADRVAIQLVLIPVLLGIIRSDRQLHIHMIQNDGPQGARVRGHSVTTWMRLASDMRDARASGRLRPHAHGHGAAVERESAVATRRHRPPVRTVDPDGTSPGRQVSTTSV